MKDFQTKGPGKQEKPEHSSKREAPELEAPISNSYMCGMMFMSPYGLPNSVMREMMDPAEDEAERLSAGIRSGTPDSVRKEMGRRLGSDFSTVNFHSDRESVRSSNAMRARAYTRGIDVYFGEGGFDPSVGAHELVHTVQQRAVPGHVSQYVPNGAVQMMPKWLERLRRHFRRTGDEKVLPRAKSEAPEERPAAPAPRIYIGKDDTLKGQIIEDYDASSGPSAAAGKIPQRTESAPLPEIPVSSSFSSPDEEEPMVVRPTAVKPAPSLSLVPASGHSSPDLEEETPPPPASGHSSPDLEEETPPPPASSHSTPGLKDEKNPIGAEVDVAEEDADLPADLEYLDAGDGWVDLLPGGTCSSKTPIHPEGKKGIFSQRYGRHFIINNRGQIEIIINGEWRLARPIEKRKPAADDSKDGEKPAGKGPGNDSGKKDLKKKLGELNAEAAILTAKGEPEEEEAIPPWDGPALKPLESEDYDPEDDLGHFPQKRSGRYHPGFSAIGKAKKFNSYAGLAESATRAFTGADQLAAAGLDYGVSGLEPGTGPFSLDYAKNEGPYLEGASSLLGAGTALIGTVTNAHDMIRHGANVGAGGEKAEAVQSGLDMLASGGKVLSSGAAFLDTVGAMSPAADFIPGMNIATGSLTAISGTVQGVRGGIALHKIKKEIKALQRRANSRRRREKMKAADARASGTASEDANVIEESAAPVAGTSAVLQEDGEGDEKSAAEAPQKAAESPEEKKQNKLWQIFHHGKWISEYNRTAGAMKAGSGVLSVGSGVATLTGAGVAVGAALGAANGALGVGRFAYDKIKKKHIRDRVLRQEMGIPDGDLDEDKILQKYHVNSIDDAFAIIIRERAKYLLDLAGRQALNDEDDDAAAADRVINALGVHRMKDGSYAPGAEELLAEKLR